MYTDNSFDKKLELYSALSVDEKKALCYVNDTLDLAWECAKSIFGEKEAKPEHALKICELMLNNIKNE